MNERRPIAADVYRADAAAAGCAAVPLWIPSGVLAAPGRPGANDRIGVAYIGVGRRGQQLMGLPRQGRIVAVSDIYRDRAERDRRQAEMPGVLRLPQDARSGRH